MNCNLHRSFKKGSLFIATIIMCAIGDSLTIKAAIGNNAYEAVSVSLNALTGIRIGTVSIFLNILMIFLQLLIERKGDPGKLLQLLLALIYGNVTNLVLYGLLGRLVFYTYLSRMIFALIGLLLTASSIGVMMPLNVVTFPLESLCKVISDHYRKDFSLIRQAADIVCIVATVLMSLLCKIPFSIREGTVIGALIMGPVMGKVKEYITPIIDRCCGKRTFQRRKYAFRTWK